PSLPLLQTAPCFNVRFRKSPFTIHETTGIHLFVGGGGGFFRLRNNSSLAGVSRTKLLRCVGRCEAAGSNRSDKLSPMENPSALLALFAVYLGRPAFPHDLCRWRGPDAVLSAGGRQTGVVAGNQAGKAGDV